MVLKLDFQNTQQKARKRFKKNTIFHQSSHFDIYTFIEYVFSTLTPPLHIVQLTQNKILCSPLVNNTLLTTLRETCNKQANTIFRNISRQVSY